jgi:hypothetical protein
VYPKLSGMAQALGVEVLEVERDVEDVDVNDLRFSTAVRSNSISNCTTVDITYRVCLQTAWDIVLMRELKASDLSASSPWN